MTPCGDVNEPDPGKRQRPRTADRRAQILRTLAILLEQPGSERVTTAALAARMGISEAALYRHFASKAQMFDGLIDFIEQAVSSFAHQAHEREPDGRTRSRKLVRLLLQFGEKNPGLTRVMVGDALAQEDRRLQQRMGLLFDQLESTITHNLLTPPNTLSTSEAHASLLTSFCVGRLQRFVRTGFKRSPTEHLDANLSQLLP